MLLWFLNNSAQLSKNRKQSAFLLIHHHFLSCIRWCFKRLLVTQSKIAIMLDEQ